MVSRLALVTLTVLGAALSVGAASCLSPTLPLPPPDEPSSMSPSAEDPNLWTISGSCTDTAVVVVTNDFLTGDGDSSTDVKADGSCSYVLHLVAQRCDRATVRVLLGEEVADTSFVVQERSNGTDADMSACK